MQKLLCRRRHTNVNNRVCVGVLVISLAFLASVTGCYQTADFLVSGGIYVKVVPSSGSRIPDLSFGNSVSDVLNVFRQHEGFSARLQVLVGAGFFWWTFLVAALAGLASASVGKVFLGKRAR